MGSLELFDLHYQKVKQVAYEELFLWLEEVIEAL
jgi:hypothetical protein